MKSPGAAFGGCTDDYRSPIYGAALLRCASVLAQSLSSRSWATASTASLYPWPRNPAMMPVAAEEIVDVWRQGSRANGLLKWSSTTTPSKVASASCSDHE